MPRSTSTTTKMPRSTSTKMPRSTSTEMRRSTSTEMSRSTSTTGMPRSTSTTTKTTERTSTAVAETTTKMTAILEEQTTTIKTTTTTKKMITRQKTTVVPSTTPTTTAKVTTKSSSSTGGSKARRPGSRIPKVFDDASGNQDNGNPEENAINVFGSTGSASVTPATTTLSGTTTSWLFGLMNTTSEFSSSGSGSYLEREDPPIGNSVNNRKNHLKPRRRLGSLSPVKIDVSSPEELAGVAVNAKVLHLFLGGPNSTSLHDSVVTVAKAVNQYNNYYRKRKR
ncbi:mucin-12-like [Varroa destructor]|uniref:Uncharacterized protein n=1 Tax=Varroa destructor TaxID=109461 RepID=A0A7M7K868_VARDE|nr:mucin-12-like [Varroa destructor]